MSTFLGCCVIAAAILYVGRKLGRMLFAIGAVLEEAAKRSVGDWPSAEEWQRFFRR